MPNTLNEKFHEVANLFPLMSDDEYKDLVEDIGEHTQIDTSLDIKVATCHVVEYYHSSKLQWLKPKMEYTVLGVIEWFRLLNRIG